MEHLYPTTVNLSISENNNNKTKSTSTKIAFYDKIKEHKRLENSADKNEKDVTTMGETNCKRKQKPEAENSRTQREEYSSVFISPQIAKTSSSNYKNPVKPLTIDEPSINHLKVSRTDTSVSMGSSTETNDKDNIMDIEARMHRERARILGGYSNTPGNTQRVRDDQVKKHVWSYDTFLTN